MNFKTPGGRFYRFALMLAGPPVWVMTVVFAFGVEAEYQSFGIGIATIITAIGVGSGISKAGSAQQAKYSNGVSG